MNEDNVAFVLRNLRPEQLKRNKDSLPIASKLFWNAMCLFKSDKIPEIFQEQCDGFVQNLKNADLVHDYDPNGLKDEPWPQDRDWNEEQLRKNSAANKADRFDTFRAMIEFLRPLFSAAHIGIRGILAPADVTLKAVFQVEDLYSEYAVYGRDPANQYPAASVKGLKEIVDLSVDALDFSSMGLRSERSENLRAQSLILETDLKKIEGGSAVGGGNTGNTGTAAGSGSSAH